MNFEDLKKTLNENLTPDQDYAYTIDTTVINGKVVRLKLHLIKTDEEVSCHDE